MDPDTITSQASIKLDCRRNESHGPAKNRSYDEIEIGNSAPYFDELLDDLEIHRNDDKDNVNSRIRKIELPKGKKTQTTTKRNIRQKSPASSTESSVMTRKPLMSLSATNKPKIAIHLSQPKEKNSNDLIQINNSYSVNSKLTNVSDKVQEQHQTSKISEKSAREPKQTADNSEKIVSGSNGHLLRPISSTSSTRTRTVTDGKSRSSTMPGFAERSTTGRIRRFNDGLRVFEEKSGRTDVRKMLTKSEATAKRKQANAEAMYTASASVPDSLIAFTGEIHKVTRISPTEEKELGNKTQEAIHLQELFQKLETELDREPTDDEWCAAAGKINMEAIKQAIEDGVEAKNQLVTSNLRMVQGVVNLYIRNGLGSQYNAADLMQEGIVALIRAAEKFEPSRGFRFSTYAMYWIRAAVKRSQILQSRVIHVPQRLHETNKKISKVEKELHKELGRKPEKEELAISVGITVPQLERCRKAMAQECYSLDSAITNTLKPNSGDRSKDTMYDLIDAKSEDEEYKKLDQLFLREDLINTLHRYLSPHEVDLILLRYGLMDERALPHGFSGPLTIADVSRLVGLKPDKVRRIIKNCLRQLRHLIANEWEDFERELT